MNSNLQLEYQEAIRKTQKIDVLGFKVNRETLQTIMDSEDSIQTRVLYTLEHPETLERYQDNGHFERSLQWYARKRSIRIWQSREKMVSLNELENTDNGYNQIFLNLKSEKYSLYKYVLNYRNAKGKRVFTTKQMRVLCKRVLGQKTETEIAREMNLAIPTVWQTFKAIDNKLMGMDLRDSVNTLWYHG